MTIRQQRRRVAILTSFDPPTHYSRYLTQALARATPQWQLAAVVERDTSPPPPGITVLPAWQRGALAYFCAYEAIRRFHPDLVHIQHELTMYGGPLSTALFPLLLALLRLEGFPVVTTVHAVVAPWEVDDDFLRAFGLSGRPWRQTAVRLLFRAIYRAIGILSDEVIVHSPWMRRQLVLGYSIPKARVSTIPIGISEQPETAPQEPSTEPWWDCSLHDAPFFLFFGYLVRRKGLEYLIKAFSQFATTHPKHRLVIAGGVLEYQRDYASKLAEQVQGTSVANRILFTGFLEPEAIHWLYTHCLAVVLPYAYSISASLPLSFAYQHGKPVVGTSLGSLCDDIHHHVNGLLVEPRSVSALHDGLARIADDDALRAQLAAGATATARARTWNQCAQSTVTVYDNVLVRRAKSW